MWIGTGLGACTCIWRLGLDDAIGKNREFDVKASGFLCINAGRTVVLRLATLGVQDSTLAIELHSLLVGILAGMAE